MLKPLIFVSILGLGLLSCCVTTTTISSIPEGAKVVVDGKTLGTTPVIFATKKSSLKKHDIQISLLNYQTLDTTLTRNQNFKPVRLIGFPVLVPLLYLSDFNAENQFSLIKNQLQTANALAEENSTSYKLEQLQHQLAQIEEKYEKGELSKRKFNKQRKQILLQLEALKNKR